MKRLIVLVITGSLSIVSQFSQAQVPQPPVNVQSPNAASLGLFGEVPVSYFSGIPDISIPLYQFQENGISVPVTLSYHASGFRPDAHPGWTGLGWALSAGGVITRTIRDAPDDQDQNLHVEGASVVAHPGFYLTYGGLNVSNWDQLDYMHLVADNDYMYDDTEPDEFSFSFPGGSGKFYLDHTRQWRVKCDKPVKVSFNGQFLQVPFTAPPNAPNFNYGYFPSFSGFTITDEKGDQYVFGGNTNAIEYGIGFFSQNTDLWTADAWYLTKIIHADGYEVDFNYEKDNDFINQLYISIFMDRQTRTVSSGGIFSLQPGCSSSSYGNSELVFIDGKLQSPSYLRSITGSTTKVVFNRSVSTELRYDQSAYSFKYTQYSQAPHNLDFLPFLQYPGGSYPDCLNKLQWKRLDEIDIEDKDGNIRKSFSFAYNNIATDRLTLLSLTEKGKDGGAKPPYQFFYDNSQPLPPYLANKSDHWGFYNGTYASIADQNTYYSTYYNYRQPQSAYLLAGTLNRIIYPTGGETDFTFEPNYYSKRLSFNRTDGIDPSYNTNTLAGGLRIRKISSFDPNSTSPPKTKEYFYVNGFTNSLDVNSLYSSGILGGQIQYYYDDYRLKAFNDNDLIYSKSLFSSQSVLPVSGNSQGTHVGYSEVAEKLSDGSYTRYFYTNFDNGHIDEPVPTLQVSRTPYEPASSLESERGVLLKEETYTNSDVLVRQRAIQYLPLDKSNQFVRAMSARYINVCSNTAVSVDEGVAYRNYIYSYLPSTETVTQYDVNGQHPYITTTNYNYNSQYRQLSAQSYTDSKGQNTTTYFRYPYDALAYTPAAGAGINETTAYMVQNNYVGLPLETIHTKVINGIEQVTDAKLTAYGAVSGKIKPAFDFKFASTTPVPKSSYTNYSVTNYAGGTETTSKDSRLVTDVAYDAYDTRGNLQSYGRYKDIKTSYLWSYSKTFPVAVVTNALPGQIAYTSFEDANDLGGWTQSAGSSILTGTENVTGTKSFSGTITTTLSIPGNYIVTLWGHTGGTQTVNGLSGTALRTLGPSTLLQWKLSNPSTVTVTGDNIDELRLYPENAQMTTYTYDPLSGMTSASDLNGFPVFYEYDEFERLHFVRDQDRNLVKKINYNYRGAAGTVFYNAAHSYPFIRTCSGVGGNYFYVVPAATYSSVISQQDADHQADLDAAANGPRSANINGPCDVSPIPLSYWKTGTVPYTVALENTVTHVVYTFSLINDTGSGTITLGSIPRGHYNVTFNTSSTAQHQFVVANTSMNGTTTAVFTNIFLPASGYAILGINGNQ